jgi:hypothetical protein
MPDPYAAQSLIYNSLAAGEISPALYGRTDLAKFHQGAFTMRNFFVDYRGGAKTRPGTQFIGISGTSGYVRLYPFKFSAAIGQTYILVFSAGYIEFIKNPGGTTFPNSSNAAFILATPPNHYAVATPYAVSDLPNLKFSQLADVLTIVHHNYPRYNLSRLADNNWTFTAVADPVGPATPTMSAITVTGLPTGSTDPQNTYYIYAVAAVDTNGNESMSSAPLVGGPGIDIGATQGTVSVFWNAVAGAQYYKVYKGLPSPGGVLPPLSQSLGFCAYAYGTSFADSNIVPDFTKTPLQPNRPFDPGQVTGYSITNPGTGYPVGATSLTLAGGGTPSRPAVLYPILGSNTAAATAAITGITIADPGSGYATTPTVAATGGSGAGFAATLTLGPTSGVNPGAIGLFQQRQIYADTANQPNTLWASRSGTTNDFRTTNPVVDSDSLNFTIASQQVNRIVWVQSMPGGLVIGTDSGIVQLTGGSSTAANPLAVTPTSAVVVPQSYFGSSDLPPITINYDILYVQSEGAIVRDLTYQFFINIYTGSDVTSLSSHLFYPLAINAWAYQDIPNKVIWCIRNDAVLLSLTFLKEQEVLGWARHDTAGQYESVAAVQEGTMDALYVSVNRNGVRMIERFADQVYLMADDAWCLDAALSTPSTYPAASLTASGYTGTITLTASAAVFSAGNVGSVIRGFSGKAAITGYTSPTQITAQIVNTFNSLSFGQGAWRMDPVVATVSGLTHLNGYANVMALVDGAVQGPFTVSGGTITLTTPGSQVIAGLPFQAQLQPLYADLGGDGGTIQGRRKKAAAATIRVRDTARIKFGTDFQNLREWQLGTAGTDPADAIPGIHPGLYTGDQRMVINQLFSRVGSVAIQQDYPLPATVLAVVPELAQGDTR